MFFSPMTKYQPKSTEIYLGAPSQSRLRSPPAPLKSADVAEDSEAKDRSESADIGGSLVPGGGVPLPSFNP